MAKAPEQHYGAVYIPFPGQQLMEAHTGLKAETLRINFNYKVLYSVRTRKRKRAVKFKELNKFQEYSITL